jgi:hypothetical protein
MRFHVDVDVAFPDVEFMFDEIEGRIEMILGQVNGPGNCLHVCFKNPAFAMAVGEKLHQVGKELGIHQVQAEEAEPRKQRGERQAADLGIGLMTPTTRPDVWSHSANLDGDT